MGALRQALGAGSSVWGTAYFFRMPRFFRPLPIARARWLTKRQRSGGASECMPVVARAGRDITAKDATSLPLPPLFPVLRRKFFRPLLRLLRGPTRLRPGRFDYQGLLFAAPPNEADLP